VTKIDLYVEGGGDNAGPREQLRQAIGRLLERGLADRSVRRRPKVVVCGSVQKTLQRFEEAISNTTDAVCAVLVDADGPVPQGRLPAAHLLQKHGWAKPNRSADEQIHLMVQTMEAWIVADIEALQAYYGDGFRPNSLSNRENVEEIPKSQLERGLKQATRSTKKGSYEKIRHARQLLPRLNAAKIAARAQRFKQLLEFLSDHLK
jgi:hypothetical protein